MSAGLPPGISGTVNKPTSTITSAATNTTCSASANAPRTRCWVSAGKRAAACGDSSEPALIFAPGNSSCRRSVSVVSINAAAMATPNTPPSWRVKLTRPLATPMRGRSTEFCAASMVAMKPKPMPVPMHTMAMLTSSWDESTPDPA